jgi:hypothetical protein
MMRALEDLDRVDAGKAPRRGLRPEVRSATDRWVHGNTAKVASTYAKAGGSIVRPPRRRRGWVIALVVVLAIAALSFVIPASRSSLASIWQNTPFAQRVLPAVPVTTHGPYAFEKMTDIGSKTPMTYSPCRPISYTINSDLAPAGSDGIIQSAVAEVSRLTGLKFVYAGQSHSQVHWTQTISPGLALGEIPPVEIAWSSTDEFINLKGDVLGFAASAYTSGAGVTPRYVTGSIALRAAELGQALQRPGGRAYVKAVVLHELGHVVGLAHVQDVHELMNPLLYDQRDFGPGDREGLALLGQGSCS